MDLASIPSDYFDKKWFFMRGSPRLRKKPVVVNRYGRPIRKKKVKRQYPVNVIFIYLVLITIFVALTVVLVLIRLGHVQWRKSAECVPGFDIGECERMDFLDTYIWKEDRYFDVGNRHCSYGVAFRTWAPLATFVSVVIVNDTSSASYPMVYILLLQLYHIDVNMMVVGLRMFAKSKSALVTFMRCTTISPNKHASDYHWEHAKCIFVFGIPFLVYIMVKMVKAIVYHLQSQQILGKELHSKIPFFIKFFSHHSQIQKKQICSFIRWFLEFRI